jgi:hypothetical protein
VHKVIISFIYFDRQLISFLSFFTDEIGEFDAADLDRDIIAERLKKDDVRGSNWECFVDTNYSCLYRMRLKDDYTCALLIK